MSPRGHDAGERTASLHLTASGERLRCHLLLSEGAEAREVTCNGEPVQFTNVQVEQSPYVDLVVEDTPGATIAVRYARS
jgi:hypothetical protein